MFWLSWYWIFCYLESLASGILDRPKGKRTQNIFCPPTHKKIPNSHTPNSAFTSIPPNKYFVTPSYKLLTKLAFCLKFMFPSNWLKDKTKTLAIYHSSGPWKFALKSFRQDAWEIKPEKEKPTTPGNRPTSHNQSLAAEEHSSPITVSKQKLPEGYQTPGRGRPPGLLPHHWLSPRPRTGTLL